MSTVSKSCVRCHTEKPVSEFYIRSGCKLPTDPGHYLSECKACMKQRNQSTNPVPPTVPRAPTEILAIEYLRQHKVPALPGKAIHAVDVDVVAWGHVWIEIKFSRLESRGQIEQFTFATTPKQQQRGFLAHLVMLICDYGDKTTYHLFRANHPVFYIHDRIKSGFTFTPGAMEAKKHGANRVVMTQPLMDEAQDRVALVYEVMKEIEEAL